MRFVGKYPCPGRLASQKKTILRFVGWYFFVNTLVFWLLGAAYLRSILLSTSLFHNYIADYSSIAGKLLVLLFTLTNYLSYMMLLAFVPALFVVIFAVVFPFKRFIWFISVLFATLSVIFIIVDNQTYAMFKFHMNTTLLTMAWSRQLRDVFDFSHYELMIVMGLIVSVFLVECMIAWFVWHKVILTHRLKIGKTIAVYWFGGMLFSYSTLMLSMTQNNNLFVQQAPNLPLFNQWLSLITPGNDAREIIHRYSEHHYTQTFYSHDALDYPRHPLQCMPSEKPYNIILIMVDALRFDSLQPKYMPKLTQFSQKSWQFLQHLSGGNSTQAGLFTLFYSIPSNYWTAALEQKIPPVLSDVLQKNGYTMRAIWSSEMQNPPMDKTIYLGFKKLNVKGAPGTDVGNWDRYTTQQAIDFLTSKNTNRPFFLHLFYDAPHGYCRTQSFPAPHQPVHQQCSRMAMSDSMDPLPFYNRYLNAVTFVDEEVNKVLMTIEKQGYLKNSIVIFTSDHGQEFNDNQQNYWGHAGNFTSFQVQVPLIIHWPNEPARKVQYMTSSYDVVPTILQRVFHCKNAIADYSVGQNLLKAEDRLPFILAGSYVNMGIIEPDRLDVLQTSGGFCVTDKSARPMPGEKPRMTVLHRALALMRKYFSSKGKF